MTKCFAAISVFWILVRVFVNTRSPVSRHNSICKCCSDFITVIFQEPKTLCFIGIQHLFTSEQWFLDLVSVFVSTSLITCLDAVLFVKVVYSLLHHPSIKRKHFVSSKYNSHLASSSGLWIFSWILAFACLDTVLFVKVAQTWLHHASRKRTHFTSLKCKQYFAPISVFWTLVSAFSKTWFHLNLS